MFNAAQYLFKKGKKAHPHEKLRVDSLWDS